ncbi:MAG: replication-associated recombination protein A [Actinomycetota bacterium]
MRPRTLEELAGQQHIVGRGMPLRNLIESDRLTSAILWGPAGTGKTSLAHIIAETTKADYETLSAVNATVADVRKAIARAAESAQTLGRKTILFIDEIHRFNKGQQDALLPAVEAGTIVLIGATTENPYFSINSPLLSRSMLFRLDPLGRKEIVEILRRAITDEERGLGGTDVDVSDDAVDHIVDRAGGDARAALNALDTCVSAAIAAGETKVTADLAENALQGPVLHYGDDAHYDVISAFIKSMRGSDPDAAVWWLAEMLEAGEDARFIARRMVIFASEDVGNADPAALPLAVAAAQAVEFVGLPEVKLNLAHAAIYLACAPKSNAATVAISRASRDVAEHGHSDVPMHLRDASYGASRKLGHGKGYRYPHDHPEGYVDQDYRPPEISGRRYYEPTDRGAEKEIKQRLRQHKNPTDRGAEKGI